MKSGHDIIRTSPMPGKFIGTCQKCGKEGLTFSNMDEECPNPSGMTQDQSLLKAIKEK